MTAKEAYELLKSKWNEFEAVSCHETKTLFIFKVIPNGYTGDPNKLMDNLCSVDKFNKQVRVFQPFHIPAVEFRSSKKIENFK